MQLFDWFPQTAAVWHWQQLIQPSSRSFATEFMAWKIFHFIWLYCGKPLLCLRVCVMDRRRTRRKSMLSGPQKKPISVRLRDVRRGMKLYNLERSSFRKKNSRIFSFSDGTKFLRSGRRVIHASLQPEISLLLDRNESAPVSSDLLVSLVKQRQYYILVNAVSENALNVG